MAHKFVGEPQRTILDSIAGQHDAILAGGAANQAHVAHGTLVLARAESARRRNLPKIVAVGELQFEAFLANQRMWKIDGVRNGISIGGMDGDELVSFAHL